MDLLRLLAIMAPLVISYALMSVGTRIWLYRLRGRTVGLRGDIEAQVRFATTLNRASIRGKGLGSGVWLSLQGPRRLTVGTDAFIFSAPNALKEYVFRGSECSIALSQAPSRFANRDWIIITGPASGRQVQLAISHDNLMEVWQALAATGAAT
jgi:hypothetical protein